MPEILPLALDRHEDLVQEPRVTESAASPPQLAGVLDAELPGREVSEPYHPSASRCQTAI